MRKPAKLLVAVLGLFTLASSTLFAQLQTKLENTSGYRDPNSQGGEFTAYLSGDSSLDSEILNNYYSGAKVGTGSSAGFETFCIEIDETFTANTTYNASIGTEIEDGKSETPLTEGVALLYSLFASGALANYTVDGTTYTFDYSPGNEQEIESDELQDAIWYLEGEIPSTGDSFTTNSSLLYKFGLSTKNGKKTVAFNPESDPFVELAEEVLGTNATKAATADYDDVEVLELTTTVGDQAAQDQLIYCPVPEPATFAAGAMLLLPLGWSVLRFYRKKNSLPQFAVIPVPEPEKLKPENSPRHDPSAGTTKSIC